MVKKKHIEWSLLAPWLPILMAIPFFVLYYNLPFNEEILGFLGLIAMVLAGIGGVFILLAVVLATIDVIKSKLPGLHKIIWLGALWLVGYLAVVGYYFLEVRKRSDPV